jgi:hypothetical protein
MRRNMGCCALVLVASWVAATPALAAERWSAPERITGSGFSPAAAIGAGGTAVIAWVPAVGDFGGRGIRVTVRDPAGGYAPPQDLETEAAHPRLAVSGDGDAFAVWTADGVVKAAVRPAGGAFGAPQELGRGPAYQTLDVVSDAAGEAVAVWESADGARLRAR